MNVGARLSLLVAMLVILGACGLPSETGGSPSTTTVPLADSEEPAMAIISVTACRETDPWTMVETAFQGTVTAIEPEAAGTEGDTLQVELRRHLLVHDGLRNHLLDVGPELRRRGR